MQVVQVKVYLHKRWNRVHIHQRKISRYLCIFNALLLYDQQCALQCPLSSVHRWNLCACQIHWIWFHFVSDSHLSSCLFGDRIWPDRSFVVLNLVQTALYPVIFFGICSNSCVCSDSLEVSHYKTCLPICYGSGIRKKVSIRAFTEPCRCSHLHTYICLHLHQFSSSTIDWCERNYQQTVYVAEFFNCLSSFGFIGLGLFGAVKPYRHGLTLPAIMSFMGVVVLGIGSALFYRTLLRSYQLWDELPKMLFSTSFSRLSFSSYASLSKIRATVMLNMLLSSNFPMTNFRLHPVRTAGIILGFNLAITLTYIQYGEPLIFLLAFGTTFALTVGCFVALECSWVIICSKIFGNFILTRCRPVENRIVNEKCKEFFLNRGWLYSTSQSCLFQCISYKTYRSTARWMDVLECR